jgi:hypothetical protein
MKLKVFEAASCLLLANLLAAAPAQAQFKANTYHECLLEATRQGLVGNPTAIGKVKNECRERFPKSVPTVAHVDFDNMKLSAIDLWTSRAGNDDIRGTVYNGNPDVGLLQITLLLTPVNTGDPVQDFFDSEEFEIALDIPPKGTGAFAIPAAETNIKGRFRWKIIKAAGY